MTADILVPRSARVTTSFIVQMRGDDIVRNAGTPLERTEPYWFHVSTHPGTLEQTVEHIQRAFSGEIRVVHDSVVVWEGTNV